jgi:hypothetical protein
LIPNALSKSIKPIYQLIMKLLLPAYVAAALALLVAASPVPSGVEEGHLEGECIPRSIDAVIDTSLTGPYPTQPAPDAPLRLPHLPATAPAEHCMVGSLALI